MKTKLKPFTIQKRSTDHSRYAAFAVHGFWSGDNVNVTQSTNYRDGKWETPDINWSTGGRDLEKEPDDITAVRCFAKAMNAAARVAAKWKKQNP